MRTHWVVIVRRRVAMILLLSEHPPYRSGFCLFEHYNIITPTFFDRLRGEVAGAVYR
jgi:hypothetical protein